MTTPPNLATTSREEAAMSELRVKIADLTKFRKVLKDGCSGKDKFATYAAAETEIGNLIRKRGSMYRPGLDAYHCSHCHWWHLGHPGGTIHESA
jgi:hypothetical protein